MANWRRLIQNVQGRVRQSLRNAFGDMAATHGINRAPDETRRAVVRLECVDPAISVTPTLCHVAKQRGRNEYSIIQLRGEPQLVHRCIRDGASEDSADRARVQLLV